MTTNEPLSQASRHGDYAGFITRMVAFITDQVIVAVVVAGAGVFVNFVAQTFQLKQALGLETVTGAVAAIVGGATGLIFNLVYCAGFWTLAGQTPGKWLMGLVVVQTNGKRLKLGRALLRWLGYWLSGILFLGFLWVLLDSRRQGFHDKLARTLVVYSRPEEARRAALTPSRDRPSDPGGQRIGEKEIDDHEQES
jgi:uncharacterized RDD family membrane protein YckC